MVTHLLTGASLKLRKLSKQRKIVVKRKDKMKRKKNKEIKEIRLLDLSEEDGIEEKENQPKEEDGIEEKETQPKEEECNSSTDEPDLTPNTGNTDKTKFH